VRSFFPDLLDYTERLARAEIERWPDGEFSFEDFIDDDGLGNGPLRLSLTVKIAGDEIEFDFRDTCDQTPGAINARRSLTESCSYLALRCAMSNDIPNNGGYFRPTRIRTRPDSLLDCTYPSAVAARGLTAVRIIDVCFGALVQAVPAKIPAGCVQFDSGITVASRADGVERVFVEFLFGSWGGRETMDGVDGVSAPGANGSIQPVEIIEELHPIRIRSFGFVPDSGGPGAHRGGLALQREYEILADNTLLQVRADRQAHPPYGIAGGEPGVPGVNLFVGQPERLPSKFTRLANAGDVFVHRLAGAGGRGDARARARDAIVEDLLDEKITLGHAQEAYGFQSDAEMSHVPERS
jgi:N-methylhydantoinase B